MRKFLFKSLALFIGAFSIFAAACGGGGGGVQAHVCAFDQEIVSEAYLKSEASCKSKAEYYYSCECGEKGAETFQYGFKTSHDFTAERAESQYLKKAATCEKAAEYYKSCTVCGLRANYYQTFTYGELGECDFSKEVPDGKYLKTEATKTAAATYYKSCACGKQGEETFSYGEPLKTYTEAEKIPYTPVSLTVTLFDAENSVYGFTCNTEKEPLRPVLQIQKGGELTEDCLEFDVSTVKQSSYSESDTSFTYYILKAEAPLEANAEYTYRIYDKYVETGTAPATLQTKDTKSTEFSFTHVADTQAYATNFGTVLNNVVGNTDFLLHTGDVVESSKHEHEWKEMLHGNAAYLSKVPMMAISGNHETTYKNGSNETFKHFHNKLPTQASTKLGYFYSFTYGNTKFIMLNTNDLTGNKLKTEQYDWLVDELKNNTATWTIVSMHNPMYSVGKYGSDTSRNQICLALRAQLQAIFAQYGVDVVLQGHDHTVSRTFPINGQGQPQTETWQTENGVEYSVNPDGVLYLMHGTSGGQTRSPYAVDSTLFKYGESSKACSWAKFEIRGNTMTIRVNYYQSGTVKNYQTWGIKKTAAQ